MATSDDPTDRPFIVGYDGSEAADAALRFARLLAAGSGREVVAATVYRGAPYRFAPGAARMADAELVEEMRQEALRLLDGVPDGVRTCAVPGESAAHGLHAFAEQEDAGLLAVGTTHRGAVGRVLLGGVPDRLLHGAPCPVAVVPAEWDAPGCRTVGVAYDGRPESAAALVAAETLALGLGARLVAIAVYDSAPWLWLTTTAAPAPAVWDVAELHEAFEHDVQAAVAALDPALETEVRTLDGPPGPTLVEASRDGIDLLVTGSRGYGPLGSVLAGSVSRYVADHAEVPLMVVPRSAVEAEADEAEAGG
jgi:nucleotide-binding universal stress UspA family protein